MPIVTKTEQIELFTLKKVYCGAIYKKYHGGENFNPQKKPGTFSGDIIIII